MSKTLIAVSLIVAGCCVLILIDLHRQQGRIDRTIDVLSAVADAQIAHDSVRFAQTPGDVSVRVEYWSDGAIVSSDPYADEVTGAVSSGSESMVYVGATPIDSHTFRVVVTIPESGWRQIRLISFPGNGMQGVTWRLDAVSNLASSDRSTARFAIWFSDRSLRSPEGDFKKLQKAGIHAAVITISAK